MKNRIISVFLTVAMVLTILPVTAITSVANIPPVPDRCTICDEEKPVCPSCWWCADCDYPPHCSSCGWGADCAGWCDVHDDCRRCCDCPFEGHTVQLMARAGRPGYNWASTRTPYQSEEFTITENGERHTLIIEDINEQDLISLSLMTAGANFCDGCNQNHGGCGFSPVEESHWAFEDAIVIFESVEINGVSVIDQPIGSHLIGWDELPWAEGHADAQLWNGWVDWYQRLSGISRIDRGNGVSFALPGIFGNDIIETIEVTFFVTGIYNEYCECGECSFCTFEECCPNCCYGIEWCNGDCEGYDDCCYCEPCGDENCCVCNGCPGCVDCFEMCCYCCKGFENCDKPCRRCCDCKYNCESCCFCDEPCGDCFICNTCWECWTDPCICCEKCESFPCECPCGDCGLRFCVCPCDRCDRFPCRCRCSGCNQLPSTCSQITANFNNAGTRLEVRAARAIPADTWFVFQGEIKSPQNMTISQPRRSGLPGVGGGGGKLGNSFIFYMGFENVIPAGAVLFYFEVSGRGTISIDIDIEFYNNDTGVFNQFSIKPITINNIIEVTPPTPVCKDCGRKTCRCPSVKPKPTHVMGRILPGNNRAPGIGDALEIFKFLAGMGNVIEAGGKGSREWNASLITGSTTPGIADALEIFKLLAGMDSVLK